MSHTLNKFKIKISAEWLLYFIAIAALIGFRQTGFRFIPVMWAEDGSINIQRAIDFGWSSVFQTYAGYYMITPQIITCFWYSIFKMLNNITLLWWCIGYTCLAIESLCVVYFVSDRFAWLVPKRHMRFIASAVVAIAPWGLSQNNEMLMHCTNICWWMFWTCFLISLDLLCNPQIKPLKWYEIILLVLIALSSAMAPLVVGIAVLVSLRWLLNKLQTHTFHLRAFAPQVVKLGIVLLAAGMQIITIFGTPRADVELALFNRVWILLKNFTILPPLEFSGKNSIFPLLIGFIFWLFLVVVSKVSIRVVLYSFGFSFSYWVLCSTVHPTIEDLKTMGLMGGVRYLFIQYMVWALMISVAIIKLFESQNRKHNYLSCYLSLALFILLATRYNVNVPGGEFMKYYQDNAIFYDKNGTDSICIPEPPWRPWGFTIPANLSSTHGEPSDGILVAEAINGQSAATPIIINSSDILITGWASSQEHTTFENLFIKVGNTYYPAEKTSRLDVAADYQASTLDNCGFQVYVPQAVFSDGATTLEFVAFDIDGNTYYMTQNLTTAVTAP